MLSIIVVEHEHKHGSQSHVKQHRDPYKVHHDQLEDASVTDYDPPIKNHLFTTNKLDYSITIVD